jgi:hypothetical protein
MSKRDIIDEDEEWLRSLDGDEATEMVGLIVGWLSDFERGFLARLEQTRADEMRWQDDGGRS